MYYLGKGKYQNWIDVLEKFIPPVGTVFDNTNINYFMNKEQLQALEDLRIYANIYYYFHKFDATTVTKNFGIKVKNDELDPGIDSLISTIIEIFPCINNIKLVIHLLNFESNYRSIENPKFHAYKQAIISIWTCDTLITRKNYFSLKGVGDSIGNTIDTFLKNQELE